LNNKSGLKLKIHIILACLVIGLLIYVCIVIAGQTILVVPDHNLFPQWDPATHSLYGWKMYYSLIQLKPLMFFWEIWSKGLWPFMYYLFQVPFYFLTGSQIEASSFSSLFAFLCIGVLAILFFKKALKIFPLVAISVFLLLLISSPAYLAYSSLAMTEVFGSFMQLLVFTSYILATDSKSRKHAILFSVSLTMLFFTKYNYFILAVMPLLINEYIIYTKMWNIRDHIIHMWKSSKRILSSLTGIVLFLYLIFLSILISTGGFEFQLFNQQIFVHSIGNTGYIVLYFLLIRFWILHRKKKANYAGFLSKDFRIKPLITYFILPLVIWFAIPYPNHIKEFFGLIVNRQTEGSTLLGSFSFYFNVLQNNYFQGSTVFYLAFLVFLVALIRFKGQPQITKWLVIAALVQFILVITHPYKDARFIFMALLPLWLVVAMEINNWVTKINTNKMLIYPVSLILISTGIILFHNTVIGDSFKKFAFYIYTESPELTNSFNKIRNQIGNEDRLVIIGGTNNMLSPALIEWEFGAPRGYKNFQGIFLGNDYKTLNNATHLLIIAPLHNNTDVEFLDSYNQHSEKINELISNRKVQFLTESDIDDFNFSFKIYKIEK